MYAPPTDLTDADVADALEQGWGIRARRIAYQAVGFGSHHWIVEDGARRRWFATVDDCDGKRLDAGDSLDAAFERLLAAIGASRALKDRGLSFVVAPIPSQAGPVLERISPRYALAVYPYLVGVSLGFGVYKDMSERLQVTERLVVLHGVDTATAEGLGTETFAIDNRQGLLAAMADLDADWATGPFAAATRLQLRSEAAGVRRLLDHFDVLADRARARPQVITHGEPHRGNILWVEGEAMLVDWDTALAAPAERDLWMVADADGEVAGAYQAATGRAVETWMLDLYRLRWDLIEIAGYVTLFRRPHGDDANTRNAWVNLKDHMQPAERWPALFGG